MRRPVLAPEIVLLYKAKSPAAKDEADFRASYPALDEPRRRWLLAALELCHPANPWLHLLSPKLVILCVLHCICLNVLILVGWRVEHEMGPSLFLENK